MKKFYLFTLIFIAFAAILKNSWTQDEFPNHGDIEKEKLIAKKKIRRTLGYTKFDGPDKYDEFQHAIRTEFGDQNPKYPVNYKLDEFNAARLDLINFRNSNQAFQLRTQRSFDTDTWIERGPANVPGRTRGLIIDPDDPSQNTWFAGSVGGGIWKTTNSGNSWTKLTENFPNLSTTVLAMADSNHDVIYAGTGEGFFNTGAIRGDGIFKSIDRGETWFQLSSTASNTDFSYINRIIIDPSNENVLLSANNNGIYKSEDGGFSWKKVYDSPVRRVQHIIYEPGNFQVQYAALNSIGVIKSIDGGETWTSTGPGIVSTGRIEIAVSPVNTNLLLAASEGTMSGSGSDLFASYDKGDSWQLVIEENEGANVNWLGSQGWYDNTILPHPFDENIVYVGGIQLWKINLRPGQGQGEKRILGVFERGTEAFMEYVNWGGTYLGGGFGRGEDWFSSDEENPKDFTKEDYTSVELRFGPNKKQKAHRFTIPAGRTSGVAVGDYSYQDYVEVPFEAWDVDNNRQLMVSFRDQANDGQFNLIPRGSSEDTQSREYIFIHGYEYDPNAPHPNVAQNGGYPFKLLFAIWPVLKDGFNAENGFPASDIFVDFREVQLRFRATAHMTDGYNQIDGKNREVHVDHHNLLPIITNRQAKTFRILNANDGGVYVTQNGTDPGFDFGTWVFAGSFYNTSQFYGVDKKRGADEYIGGMQDNGTWKSPSGISSDKTTNWQFNIGGDGFNVVWNYSNPQRLLGGSQFNGIRRSLDGGNTWQEATSGLTDVGSSNAPFITKLEASQMAPNRVFAVGRTGVWRSENFGGSWESSPISENWQFGSFSNVKVSIADPNIVWAGGAMTNTARVFVSRDAGKTFQPVNNSSEAPAAVVTGIGTHPFDPNTAFLTFSAFGRTKILRTKDLGQSWEDITGFSNGVSSKGFPNVAVYSVIVLPNEPQTIWAGTEIGIFESTDDGASWHMLDGNLPAASIWEMKVVDDQVVVATHGRGIWSLTIPELQDFVLNADTPKLSFDFNIYPNPVKGRGQIDLKGIKSGQTNIEVYDLNGKMVKTISAGFLSNENAKVSLDTQDLKEGIYLLRVVMVISELRKELL